jgi:eukaryotic-like serine/threonine-protein kinase
MGQEASAGGDASGASNAAAGVPQAGEVVGGKFVIERVLGVGGMGVVVAAHHNHLDKTVAIKFLRRDAAKDELAVSRFLREARAVTVLQSEHVVRVMDAGRLDDGLPYLVMEYLSGLDLDQMLAQRGQLPLEEAVEYLLQSMEAVADAHAAGIVHRDLKPSNLFVTMRADGSPLVKVLDFGISKAFDTTGANQVSLTATSMTLGSPLYMSPEQVRSSKTVDARTDIWALGIIAYELLAGVQPFEAETVTGLCAKIVADEPPPLRSIRPDVPPGFEAVVLRCLEKNPAARYPSVVDLAAALRPFASPEGLASVARITRTGGGLKPTLASAAGRVSSTDARSSTPHDSTVGYAETVASWQSAERRGKQVKTASVATAVLLAMALLALVAGRRPWSASGSAPRASSPAADPGPASSAASVIDLAAPAVHLPAPPAQAALPSVEPAEARPPELVPTAAAASVRAPTLATTASPPRRPGSLKLAATASASAGRTTDDLLLDRK